MPRLKKIDRLTMKLYRLHNDTDKIWHEWLDNGAPELTHEDAVNLLYYLVAMSVIVDDLELEVTRQQTKWWRLFHWKK